MSGATAICRVVIRGRVQGVGFRAWTEHMALRLGLDGWVRNRLDGSVEAVFAGPPDTVGAMVDACRRGPGGSGVHGVSEHDAGPDLLAKRHSGERFSVLPTE
jgi:acylphosphatase